MYFPDLYFSCYPGAVLNIEIFCVGLSLIKIFRIAVHEALGHFLTLYWNLIRVIKRLKFKIFVHPNHSLRTPIKH